MCLQVMFVNFFVKSIYGVIETEGVIFTEFWFGRHSVEKSSKSRSPFLRKICKFSVKSTVI